MAALLLLLLVLGPVVIADLQRYAKTVCYSVYDDGAPGSEYVCNLDPEDGAFACSSSTAFPLTAPRASFRAVQYARIACDGLNGFGLVRRTGELEVVTKTSPLRMLTGPFVD